MSCVGIENLIALSVSGDLDAGQAARVEAHLAACASCRALAEDLSADLQWLQSAHREPADRVMLQQVRARVMRRLEAEQGRWNRPFGGLIATNWRWQWVAVMATVVLLAGGAAWWMRPAAEPRTDVAAVAGGKEQSLPLEELTAKPEAGATGGQKDEPAQLSEATPRLKRRPESEAPAGERAVPESPAPTLAADPAEGRAIPAGQLQAELFVVSAEEPEAPPVEGVRVRMPTSNPDIVVYWLMDEKEKGD